MDKTYTLYTMDNSPYSDKIRALLNYKCIPFTEITENLEIRFSVLQARTGRTMVPVIITPDDEALNDSTPMAAFLEERHAQPPTRWNEASDTDAMGMDALAMLLEDYADEWLVRIMLCSRWYHEADSQQNAVIIATGMSHGLYGIDYQQVAKDFPPGIISTVPRMGATPENAEGWYAMVPRILGEMATALQSSDYLSGDSAHLLDFAFYGMLNQMRRDPSGCVWLAEGPEAVAAWLARLEERIKTAGKEAGGPRDDAEALVPLVAEAASTYFRMAVANALAVESESKEPVHATLTDGFEFEAAPAKYNRKMLGNDLDILERLYGCGATLPGPCEELLLAELAPLATAKSVLLAERPAVAARLGG